MNQKVCAIVDAYSSSNLYAPLLKAKGYKCIGVQSEAEPTPIIADSFRACDFEEVLKFTGNLEQMVSELKKREVSLLVPGMEMGLELADALGEKLGSHIYNDPRTSHLRRQLDIIIDVLLEPKKFLSYYNEPYQIIKHGLAVYFISKDDAHAVNAEVVEELKALRSCYSLRVASPGTRLSKTVDMFTMPGLIELVNNDRSQLWSDYEFIREQELNGRFYEELPSDWK